MYIFKCLNPSYFILKSYQDILKSPGTTSIKQQFGNWSKVLLVLTKEINTADLQKLNYFSSKTHTQKKYKSFKKIYISKVCHCAQGVKKKARKKLLSDDNNYT